MGADLTRPLADLRRADEPLFGGKSAGLGELIAAEIPVPPGFAVSSEAYLSAVEELDLDEKTPEDCARAVRGAPLPEALRAEIAGRYQELGVTGDDPRPPVAVRSSAIGEDSEGATFAGQQQTDLWVRGIEDLYEAVRGCWASLYGPEAVSYRAEITPAAAGTPAMGVAVQRMVDAAVSGVMFTCNPLSGDPSTIVIDASWGLGLAVVGGEVTPDQYRLSKVTGELLSKRLGPKRIEYVARADGSGTRRADVAPERQDVACLDQQQLGRLVEAARRVERHFGAPQDVEWAIARAPRGAGELFLLQSRPVTGIGARAERAPVQRSAIDLVMDTFGAGGGGSS